MTSVFCFINGNRLEKNVCIFSLKVSSLVRTVSAKLLDPIDEYTNLLGCNNCRKRLYELQLHSIILSLSRYKCDKQVIVSNVPILLPFSSTARPTCNMFVFSHSPRISLFPTLCVLLYRLTFCVYVNIRCESAVIPCFCSSPQRHERRNL